MWVHQQASRNILASNFDMYIIVYLYLNLKTFNSPCLVHTPPPNPLLAPPAFFLPSRKKILKIETSGIFYLQTFFRCLKSFYEDFYDFYKKFFKNHKKFTLKVTLIVSFGMGFGRQGLYILFAHLEKA